MQLSIHCKPLRCRIPNFVYNVNATMSSKQLPWALPELSLDVYSTLATQIVIGTPQRAYSLSIRNEVGEFWESWDRTTVTYAVGTLGIVTRTNLSAVVASHGIEGCVPELELHGNFSGSVTYSSSAKDTYISGVGSNYPDVLTIALIEKMRVPALAIVCSNREIVCRKTFNVTTANATWATIFQ